MDKISNQEDAERFLRGVGLTVSEEVVHQVVDVARGKVKTSWRRLWEGTKHNGVAPLCGKGTVSKIRRLNQAGELEPYLAYLDGGGTVQPANDQTPPSGLTATRAPHEKPDETIRRSQDELPEGRSEPSPSTVSTEEQGRVIQVPFIKEKRREHEAFLTSGLQALALGPLPRPIPSYYWSWSTGEPTKSLRSDLAPTDTLLSECLLIYQEPEAVRFVPGQPDRLRNVRCLLKHLETEDTILVSYRDSAKILWEYQLLCSDLYGELIDAAQQVADEVGIPLQYWWKGPVPALDGEFIQTLYHIAGNLIFDYFGDDKVGYDPFEPCADDTQLCVLRFGGTRIAIGLGLQLEKVEWAHKKLHSWLRQHPLVQQIRETRAQYEHLARKLNEAIELRVLQRVFLPGPCEICEPWGGLW
jgi:hypothetical protein